MRALLVSSLFTVRHHLGCTPLVLLRLNYRKGVAEAFVPNNDGVADTLDFAEDLVGK
jgi:hypothetical protein